MSIQLSAEDLAMLELTTSRMLDSNQTSEPGLTSLDSLLVAAETIIQQNGAASNANSDSNPSAPNANSDSNPTPPIDEDLVNDQAMDIQGEGQTPSNNDNNNDDKNKDKDKDDEQNNPDGEGVDPMDEDGIYPPSLFENEEIPPPPRSLRKGESKVGMIRVCGHGNNGKNINAPWRAAWAVKHKVSFNNIINLILYFIFSHTLNSYLAKNVFERMAHIESSTMMMA